MKSFCTDLVPERQRFTYWHDLICDRLIGVDFSRESTDDFYGRFAAQRFEDSILTELTSSAQSVTRTEDHIRRDRERFYLMSYLARGWGETRQNGNHDFIRAGDLVLHDSSRPYTFELGSDFSIVTLRVGRSMIDRYFPCADRLCAISVPGEGGAGRLASDMFRSLIRNAHALDAGSAEIVVGNLLSVVSVAYGAIDTPPVGPTSHSALLVRIRAYIEAHLRDETLCPESIAQANGISKRYLNRLFENERFTVTKLIWARRLENARLDLLRSQMAHRMISEIAYQWGFGNMSHFSVAFKAAYGASPRAYRQLHTVQPAAEA